MYERFYQLTSNPFRLEPDPNFCFSHSSYKRAREYLEYALAQGEGFVMVTGRPGTGKTLLLETFLKEIGTSNVIARRIAVSNYSGDDLQRAMAQAYDIDTADLDKATLRHRIHQYFMKQGQAGRRVLLIIDEAQALQHTALEELRILTELQTESRATLQLFLVGQESLQDLMSSPDMEQFQQRVIANYQLAPLNLQDTRSYIEHRLLQAGWKGDPEIRGDAVLSIYQLSHGVPRHINKICNRLLLLGFGKGSHAVEEQDVQEISAEMHNERLTPPGTDQATLYGADNVASIAEIRDGLISIDDLEIRADKVDANAFVFPEDSRRVSRMEEPFIDRHNNDPADWNVPHAIIEKPIAEPVTERNISRFRWSGTLVATAVILTITAISIAVLPSIPGKTTGKNRLSQADHKTRENQNTTASGSPVSPDDIVAATTDPEAFQMPVEDTDEEDAAPDRQEDVVQVAVSGVADTTVSGEEIAASADTATISLADNTEETQLLQNELQVVVTETPERAETIEQLLSKGQQSLDDFRLLTPEEDNAYGYYRAVLLLDPGNDDANEGIQEIIDRYITLVKSAAEQHEYARAKRYVTRGLSIQPENRELLALQDSIERAIQSASADTRIVADGEGAQFESESQGEGQGSLIQGLRTFFEKLKAEASSGEVHKPAGWDDSLP